MTTSIRQFMDEHDAEDTIRNLRLEEAERDLGWKIADLEQALAGI